MIYFSATALLLSLLFIFGSIVPDLRTLRPIAKWLAIAGVIGLFASGINYFWRPSTADELETKQRTAEMNAAEVEKGKAEEAEKKRQEEENKAAAEARRAELLRPPAEQVRFIQAVEYARAQYKSGQNDFQKGAARPARAQLICALLKSPRIEAWVGTIDALSTAAAGDGVLSIKIGDKITVGTWNNPGPDKIHGTLIKPQSALYQDLLRMKSGDAVRIYGQLFPRELDCYWEMNTTLAKSLEEPAWVMRLSRIERVDLAGL